MWFTDWPQDLQIRVIAWDPSKGKSDKHGDYSAVVELGVCSEGLLWVDADLERRPVARRIVDVLGRVREFQPQAVAIEANQFQELIGPELLRVAGLNGMLPPPVVQ